MPLNAQENFTPVDATPVEPQPVVTAVPLPVVQQTSRKRARDVNDDLTIDTDSRVEFDGRMQGARRLVKKGKGTLVLNQVGEMTHGVYLHEGRIELAHAQGLGRGTLAMADGSAIRLTVDGMVVANAMHMTGSDDPEIDTGGNDATYAGAITGGGFLTKRGLGQLTLTSTANHYTGATEVAEGTLKAGAAQTFAAASFHGVAEGAALHLAGFDQTVAGLLNRGTVRWGEAPDAAGTVLKITGPYVGEEGEMVVRVSGQASDRLLLSGPSAVASGSTTVQLADVDELGAPTPVQGLEIVGTEDGARLQPNAFALEDGPVDAGAYTYRLHQTSERASLQSSYRQEAVLLSALPAQLRQADMAMLGDMHRRMGERSDGAGRAAWGRMLRTDPRIRQQGTVSPQSSGHLTGFQAGLDVYAGQNATAGLYLGQLKGNMQVQGVASGVDHQPAGHNHLQSRYLGLYAAWLNHAGLYVDAIAQVADYRSQLHTTEGRTASTEGRGRLASLEVGQSFALHSHWEIEPQLQLVYRQLQLDDTALVRATVKHCTQSDWTLRLGARIKGSMKTRAGVFTPYGRVNVYKASRSTDVASLMVPAVTTDIVAKGGYLSTALAAGGSLQIDPRTRVYCELNRQWAHGGDTRVKSAMQASVGIQRLW